MKSQGASSILVFTLLFAGLFAFYALWISPEERNALLGGSNINASSNTSSVIPKDKSLYSTTIGHVGIATGSTPSGTTEIQNIKASYPKKSNLLDSVETKVLPATSLSSGKYSYTLQSLDEKLDSIDVSLSVDDFVGTPNIKISVSGKNYLYTPANKQEYKVSIPISELKKGNVIEVSCVWTGFKFWEAESCSVKNLKIESVLYEDESRSVLKDFSMLDWTGTPGTLRVLFKSNTTQNSGKLSIKINEIKLYEDNPETKDTFYVIESTTDSVGLKRDYNQLKVETEQGGVYDLSSFKIQVYAVLSTEINKTIYFSVPEEKYSSAKGFTINMDILEILDAGAFEIQIPGKVTKYLSAEDIKLGLNQINISKSYIEQGTNKIMLYSSTGRFNIGALDISYY